MPNFDALRSAIIGPLEYICRPKLAPAELLCCFPVSPNNLADKSRYNNSLYIPSSTWSDSYGLGACNGTSLLLGLSKPLKLSDPWAFEINVATTTSMTNDRTIRMTFGNYAIGFANDGATSGTMCVVYVNGNQVSYPRFARNTVVQVGLVHNSGKVGLYYNGTRQNEQTVTLSGEITSISYTSLKGMYVNNIRVIQKNLTEGTSFPYSVPATYYTGYEAL